MPDTGENLPNPPMRQIDMHASLVAHTASSDADLPGSESEEGFEVGHVSLWRRAKGSRVLPAELGCTFIADFVSGFRNIRRVKNHQAPGLKQAKLFLILHRCHCCDGPKVLVKGRGAHPRGFSKLLHA